MKRYAVLLIIMLLCIAGCGKENTSQQVGGNGKQEQEIDNTEAEEKREDIETTKPSNELEEKNTPTPEPSPEVTETELQFKPSEQILNSLPTDDIIQFFDVTLSAEDKGKKTTEVLAILEESKLTWNLYTAFNSEPCEASEPGERISLLYRWDSVPAWYYTYKNGIMQEYNPNSVMNAGEYIVLAYQPAHTALEKNVSEALMIGMVLHNNTDGKIKLQDAVLSQYWVSRSVTKETAPYVYFGSGAQFLIDDYDYWNADTLVQDIEVVNRKEDDIHSVIEYESKRERYTDVKDGAPIQYLSVKVSFEPGWERIKSVSCCIKEGSLTDYITLNNLQHIKLTEEGLVVFGYDTMATLDEALEWNVLDVQYGEVLLLLDKSLQEWTVSNNLAGEWGNCNVRKWLNEDFYDSEFNEKEKTYIVAKEVRAGKSEEMVLDKVSLLDKDEVLRYDIPTKHAIMLRDTEGAGRYFLDEYGMVKKSSLFAAKILPVIWVSLTE